MFSSARPIVTERGTRLCLCLPCLPRGLYPCSPCRCSPWAYFPCPYSLRPFPSPPCPPPQDSCQCLYWPSRPSPSPTPCCSPSLQPHSPSPACHPCPVARDRHCRRPPCDSPAAPCSTARRSGVSSSSADVRAWRVEGRRRR